MNTLSTFATQLKTAREAMGLTERDVAERLHLNTTIITQLESENVALLLPAVYIRGYLKSYANLLNMDDQELQNVLKEIYDAPSIITPSTLRKFTAPRSHYRVIKTYSYFILAIWMSCTAIWWYMHSSKSMTTVLATSPTTLNNTANIVENVTQIPFGLSDTTEQPAKTTTLATTAAPIITSPSLSPSVTIPSTVKPIPTSRDASQMAELDLQQPQNTRLAASTSVNIADGNDEEDDDD